MFPMGSCFKYLVPRGQHCFVDAESLGGEDWLIEVGHLSRTLEVIHTIFFPAVSFPDRPGSEGTAT